MHVFRCFPLNSRMIPSLVPLCLMCLLLWNKVDMTNLEKTFVHQEKGFISAEVGNSVTLQCSYDSNAVTYNWFKQPLGQKLKLISISYTFEKRSMFYDEFKDNPRFTVETEIGKSQLKISDLKLSDTGTYFCGSGISFLFEFGEGVKVSVKDSVLENEALVHQSNSKTALLGGSVTLNCVVQTGSCGGEHRVYWFKNSAGSDSGLFYTYKGRDGQCVRISNTQTHSCVYNLPIKNLNMSHIGTYYCAVASCGCVMFGVGTKLDLEPQTVSPDLVHYLTAALTFTTILSVLLIFILDKINKGDCNQSSEFKLRFSAHQASNKEGYQDTSWLHYTGISVDQSNISRRREKSTETECVYFCIKQ